MSQPFSLFKKNIIRLFCWFFYFWKSFCLQTIIFNELRMCPKFVFWKFIEASMFFSIVDTFVFAFSVNMITYPFVKDDMSIFICQRRHLILQDDILFRWIFKELFHFIIFSHSILSTTTLYEMVHSVLKGWMNKNVNF